MINRDGIIWVTIGGKHIPITGYSRKFIPTPKWNKARSLKDRYIVGNSKKEVVDKAKSVLGSNATVYTNFENIPKYNNNHCVENTRNEYKIDRNNKMTTGYYVVKKNNEYAAVAHNFNRNDNVVKDYTIIPKSYGKIVAYVGIHYSDRYKKK